MVYFIPIEDKVLKERLAARISKSISRAVKQHIAEERASE